MLTENGLKFVGDQVLVTLATVPSDTVLAVRKPILEILSPRYLLALLLFCLSKASVLSPAPLKFLPELLPVFSLAISR